MYVSGLFTPLAMAFVAKQGFSAFYFQRKPAEKSALLWTCTFYMSVTLLGWKKIC